MSVALEIKQLVERLLELTDKGVVVVGDDDDVEDIIQSMQFLQVEVSALNQRVGALNLQGGRQQQIDLGRGDAEALRAQLAMQAAQLQAQQAQLQQLAGAQAQAMQAQAATDAAVTRRMQAQAASNAQRIEAALLPVGPGQLLAAATKGLEEEVSSLLSRGADVNEMDAWGRTPLWWAAFQGHTVVAALLMQHGASVNKAPFYGHTLLKVASEGGHTAVVRMLKASDPRTRDASERELGTMGSDGFTIRPIRPEDEPRVRDMIVDGFVSNSHNFHRVRALGSAHIALGWGAAVAAAVVAKPQYAAAIVCAGVAVVGVACVRMYYTFESLMDGYIKHALGDDLKSICDFYREGSTVQPDAGPGTGFWVAVSNATGKVMGCVALQRRTDKRAEFRRLSVSRSARRQGIARALTNHAMSVATAAGVKTLFLSTSVGQPSAIDMYTRAGWVVAKETRQIGIVIKHFELSLAGGVPKPDGHEPSVEDLLSDLRGGQLVTEQSFVSGVMPGSFANLATAAGAVKR
ncbi:hypothetical protein FOA52_009925 [Chlamydomonas sp. UWO 241]|nr:hypothetical protein FOA52_009925 [Chlamydomonas sp. UWO 241]